MSVDVALVQLDVSDAGDRSGVDPARQLARVRELVAGVADADIVMLPELWLTGAFAVESSLGAAQPFDGPFVEFARSLAADHGIWLHAGSFLERSADGELFNTAVLAGPDGEIKGVYRKIHLFGFDTGEAALLTAGSEVVVVDTPLGRTGLATCYDLRFPELFRALTDAGATAVLLSSGWPEPRVARWTLLAAARAAENQVWVLGCNNAGQHAGVAQGGLSLVADPWGDVVVEAGTGEEVLRVSLDEAYPSKVRDDFPVLRDRRLR